MRAERPVPPPLKKGGQGGFARDLRAVREQIPLNAPFSKGEAPRRGTDVGKGQPIRERGVGTYRAGGNFFTASQYSTQY